MKRLSPTKTRELVCGLYHLFAAIEIARMAGKSRRQIYRVAQELGIKSNRLGPSHAKPYTARETQFIRDRYGITPVEDLAEALGRTVASVHRKAGSLKLGPRRKRFFTEAERQTIRQVYPMEGSRGVADRIGGRRSSIRKAAAKMGVRRDRQSLRRETEIECF